MGGGNGAKAQQKRERNAKNAPKAKSEGGKVAAKQEKCQFVNPKTQSQSCFTMFMTTQKPDMIKHAAAAHPGTKAEDLFPQSFKA